MREPERAIILIIGGMPRSPDIIQLRNRLLFFGYAGALPFPFSSFLRASATRREFFGPLAV